MDRGRRARGLIAALAVDLVGGCAADEDPPREAASLVDHRAWEPSPAGDDPYAARAPAELDCDLQQGVSVEDLGGGPALEIDTSWCSFVTMQQPARVDARTDEILHLALWHYDLVAPEPADAYLALALDGETVWEQWVPIPGPAELLTADVAIAAPWAQDATVQFHVDNHGLNTWDLLEITRQPAPRP
ncbi:MAG: hypothetical protein KDK70_04950 [Myxococcales bacterium]|nr:hypothetical protein [Myxococcales bacterium]